MRALCAGDLHLGAGADLGREPGERLAEQSAVLERIVEAANELGVDALLWAGDAWERRRPVVAELDAFQAPLARLECELIVVPGNHDVSHVGGITGYDVALFGRSATLIAHEPSVVTIADVDVATLPWTPRSVFVADQGGGDVDELNGRIAEKLLEVARGLRARCGERAVLVAHWSVGGASTDTGMPADLFREPVLNIADLRELGFDAVVLGHIHKPQMVNSSPNPIFYVGSPMPLNFGEATAGEERGAWLLEVGETTTSVFRIPVESRRLLTMSADIRRSGHVPWVWPDDVEEIRGSIVKMKIAATEEQARRLDIAQLRRSLDEYGAHKVWAIQVDVDRQEVVRGPKVDESIDDVEAMKAWVGAQTVPDIIERIDPILEAHSDYLQEANA